MGDRWSWRWQWIGGSAGPRALVRLRLWLTPPRWLVGSFLVLILLGTLGLRLVPAFSTGDPLGWLDALFTATSAVCVTGLIVEDTATFFTPLGQGFLLLLIQLGGLGMLTFATRVILALGGRLPLNHEAAVTAARDVAPEIESRHLIRDVVRFTLVFEGAGAVVLFLLFLPHFPVGEALWHGVFHAVSAFCNAGFSTFSDSLVGFAEAPLVLSTVMLLIIVGGLGFLTMTEITLWWRRRERKRWRRWGRPRRGPRRRVHLSIHSRLVLAVTAALLVGGAIAFATLEWWGTLARMPALDKGVNALFMSVTARTAGFNTVDYGATREASSFLTILLMSIGGSPGSTAGGLKTTTVAVIGLLAWSRFRGRTMTSIWHRTLPEETAQRAVGLFVLAFGLVTVAIFLLTWTESPGAVAERGSRFLSHMFEAVSAFNTVGLSQGVTGELSVAGRWLTIFLMFVGRVGLLAFAAAIALKEPAMSSKVRFAYERVVIG
jgi:trk system potassium uptake protein